MARQVEAVHAPVMGVEIYVSPGVSFTTGKLEEDCKFEITPNWCGKPHDLRYLDSHIKLWLPDMEARQDDVSFRNRAIYESYQNARVDFALLCGSGAFKETGFRYHFMMDPLTKRGMRWVHQLVGVSKNPIWLTFLDEGWDAFYTSIQESAIDSDSGDGNLYQY